MPINISITKKAALSLAILVSFCLMFAVSCGNSGQAPSGALPILKVGDTWTRRNSVNGSEFTEVSIVTGERVYNGIDCYTLQQTFTPAFYGASTSTMQVDKTTLNLVGTEESGSMNGVDFALTANVSRDYSVKPYPLSVGKTWTIIANTTTTTRRMGRSNISTEIDNDTYKVEKMESITVPAGTFQCFKIVEYSSTNAVVDTQWVTDVDGRWIVKGITNMYGITLDSELTSYSLSK